MTYYITSETTCPNCNSALNALTAPDHDYAPQPGDVSVCIRCAALLMLGVNFKPLLMTDKQKQRLEAEDPETYAELIESQKAVRQMNQKRFPN